MPTSPPSDDIAARAPALNPDAGGGPRGPAAIEAAQNRRIKDLEETIKDCDKALAKQARADKRRRRKTTKHIDEDEEKALVDRMYYKEVQKRKDQTEDLKAKLDASMPSAVKSSPTKLGGGYKLSEQLHSFVSQYAETNVVTRNYDNAVSKQQERREETERQLAKPMQPAKVLDPKDVEEAAVRLCTKEVEDRKDRREKLTGKYQEGLGSRGGPRSPSRKLGKNEVKESTDRLYTKSVEHRAATIDALRATLSPEPTSRKLTKAEMEAGAARMFAGQK